VVLTQDSTAPIQGVLVQGEALLIPTQSPQSNGEVLADARKAVVIWIPELAIEVSFAWS
jgi:hypothetical protein